MKTFYFTILICIILALFNAMIIKAHQQNKEGLTYPFAIFLEGKSITWLETSIPYIFIEFNSSDEIYGYIAYYRKTRGFDCFWKFKLTKHGNKYQSDSIPSCYEQSIKTKPISVVNIGNTWSVSLPEDKRNFNLTFLPKDYSNNVRNYIYALSTFQVLHSQKQNKKNWHYELSNNKTNYFKYEEEPILKGNFITMKMHIDTLGIDELANLLHIKDY